MRRTKEPRSFLITQEEYALYAGELDKRLPHWSNGYSFSEWSPWQCGTPGSTTRATASRGIHVHIYEFGLKWSPRSPADDAKYATLRQTFPELFPQLRVARLEF
jgi:hypothetical protein